MKIAIVGEHNRNSGGSYHQSLKTFEILSDINGFDINFLTINHNINNSKFINYKLNFLDKLFFMFYSSNVLKSLLKKYNIQNKFEKFIKKNKIDLIIFLGCSRLSIFCDKISFVTYIYELHHIFRPDLPEYKEWTDFDFRELLLKKNIKKALALIVDTEKKAADLIKFYNSDDKKINIIPLKPNIKKVERKDQSNFDNLDKLLKTKTEYFFYPAQYWSHKNHFYILLALKTLQEKYNKKINFVFTGHKKNNFKYIIKKTKEFNLDQQIFFFEYLKDEEISLLYQNCKALVMPSLIGYSSLPLYEAFYFEKPIFYSKNLLDKSLQNLVNEIDLDNPDDLVFQISNFENNLSTFEKKIKLAKNYFENNLSDEKIKNKYLSLLNKLKYLTNIYE